MRVINDITELIASATKSTNSLSPNRAVYINEIKKLIVLKTLLKRIIYSYHIVNYHLKVISFERTQMYLINKKRS